MERLLENKTIFVAGAGGLSGSNLYPVRYRKAL